MPRIKGLAWKENENTDDLLVGVCKLLNVDLDRRDISVSHRLAPATESNLPSLLGFAPERYETLYLANDIGYTFTTDHTQKHGCSSTRASPKPIDDVSINVCSTGRKRASINLDKTR